MQALILAGGEGTRLRPLTSTIPKPVVPLAHRPHLGHMIEWLRGHGVDDVVISSGFMAEGVRAVLGGGEDLGVRLRYAEEPEPRGTGGAIKFAEELLAERFLVLNGDVLTDLDLSEQVAQHERTGARATIALMPVEDPSAYGLVRLEPSDAVREFLEKPSPEEIDTDLISAGAYVLERSVLDLMPAGAPCSIERDVFPRLVGEGLYGFRGSGYWIDIGTPERYLEATADILSGRVRIGESGPAVHQQSRVEGSVEEPVLVQAGAHVAAGAAAGPAAVIGPGCAVEAGARFARSVALAGCVIGERSVVEDTILAPGVRVGPDCTLRGAVVGEGARIAPGTAVPAGARILPGVSYPDLQEPA